jgi:hypothetical protein
VLDGGGGGRDANPDDDAFSAMSNGTETRGGRLLTLIEGDVFIDDGLFAITKSARNENCILLRKKFLRNDERWKFCDKTGQLAS